MKSVFRVACVVMALSFLTAPGHASVAVNAYSSIDDILLDGSSFRVSENPMSWESQGLLKGTFDFVYLGKEADHTNVLLKTNPGQTIFNTDSTTAGTWARGLDITTLKLDDLSVGGSWFNKQYTITKWSEAVHIYQLRQDVSVMGVSLTAGMFIFGFNDDYKSWFCDRPDFDDMVFAAKSVPIPGAALLLGSALIGMVGMRKKFMA